MTCGFCRGEFYPQRVRSNTGFCSTVCARRHMTARLREKANSIESITTRWAEKVIKGEGCWLWSAHIRPDNGYGSFGMRGRTTSAHRASWIIHFGEIPEGLFVLHRCDNRRCVRPDHLFLGTNKDNSDDKIAKGRARHAIGEAASKARLTSGQVAEIRAIFTRSAPKWSAVAKQYGVSSTAVKRIVARETWAHL
jgi:hypothetical protein